MWKKTLKTIHVSWDTLNNIFRKRWSLKIQSALSQVDTRFEFKLRIGHNFVFIMINIQSAPINANFKNF